MSWMAWLSYPTTTTLKGKKINLERRKVRLTFVTDVRNTAEWDAMSCDEQMRLEDLIATA